MTHRFMNPLAVMLVLTEFFRLLDVTVNWGFLSTHSNYAPFLAVDIAFIILGLPAILLLRRSNVIVRPALALYAIFGLELTLLDPDFSHFVRQPVHFVIMEVPATLLFTAGLGTLLIMLTLTILHNPEEK